MANKDYQKNNQRKGATKAPSIIIRRPLKNVRPIMQFTCRSDKRPANNLWPNSDLEHVQLEMWANARRDGRPVEYRVTLPRRETR